MDKFIPDIYQKSIYDINFKKLKKRGIKCLLFDLDNTLITYEDREINNKVKNLFAKLEDDFKVIIMSNSGKKRLTPIKEALNVDVAYSSRKPFKYKYKKILALYGFKDYEVAAIGDQLITDIYGANNMGFTTIFVNRLNSNEPIQTRFNRYFEKKILRKLNKKGILEKGNYYE